MKTTIIIWILLLNTFASQGQFVTNHGALKVEGTQLVDEHNQPLVLRGMSFGWHNWWSQFYNKETVKWLHTDWHATIIRAAMGVDADENCYVNNPIAATKVIEKVIDAAIEEDIYVIIDFHSHNIHTAEAVTFFDQMSKKYGTKANVIYEIYNEPDNETWEDVKNYSEEIIKTIRKNDPDNIILVGSPHWDQDVHLAAANPIKGYSNLMYTMHFYAGTHEKWLIDRTNEALATGLPIFVSESAGMEATGNGAMNYKAWQEYIDWMESKKISWITWSVSSKDETCSVLKASASIKGKWKTKDLKESGIKTRAYLRQLNTTY